MCFLPWNLVFLVSNESMHDFLQFDILYAILVGCRVRIEFLVFGLLAGSSTLDYRGTTMGSNRGLVLPFGTILDPCFGVLVA